MRIQSETPDLLTLRESPWLLGLGIGGAVAVLLGFLFLDDSRKGNETLLMAVLCLGLASAGVQWVRSFEMSFDRIAGTVRLRQRTIRGVTELDWPLEQVLQVAQSDDRSSGPGDSNGSKLVLVLADGSRIALSRRWMPGYRVADTCQRINRWLADARA